MPRRHSRRDLFSSWFEILRGVSAPRKPDPQRVLRPPGALTPDSTFLERCTGCGDCIEACVKDCLVSLEPSQAGPESISLPAVDPDGKPCQLCDDLPCIDACKEGALVDPGSAQGVRMGVARVDPRSCITFKGKLCRLCFNTCPLPHQAIMMIGSRPLVREGACTGCGLCVFACPTTPKAIRVIPERHLVEGLRIPKEEYPQG